MAILSEKEQFEAVFSGGEWLKNIHTAADAEMLTDEMPYRYLRTGTR